MLRSMTCFARNAVNDERYYLNLELKSVNSRYFDVYLRIPRAFAGIEDRIKKRLKEKLTRGRVELYIYYEPFDDEAILFEPNIAMAKAYLRAVDRLCEELSLKNTLQIGELLKILRDVMTIRQEEEDDEQLWSILAIPLDQLIDDALQMALKEGEAMENDIRKRLSCIKNLKENISKRFDESVHRNADALQERIMSRLSNISGMDDGRILQEIAILADRMDINEELVRLESHIDQFYKYLHSKGPIGRKLDFLVQEIHREINTISSKASDSAISHMVVEMKSELEKIREQLQNVV